MSFNWSEYLSVAEGLCGLIVSGPIAGIEAQQRTGVSRAYYAGYISARNYLRDVEHIQIPTRVDAHTLVANHYQNNSDSVRAQIGIDLSRLRVARNRCDYDDVVSQLPALTRRSLIQAAQILDNLRKL
ncbi:MAG: hypothetical protein EXR50_02360 [Dehalococcoidia bacterium]|nr:hypothetical protein [Dehalococcoidia bacterium]